MDEPWSAQIEVPTIDGNGHVVLSIGGGDPDGVFLFVTAGDEPDNHGDVAITFEDGKKLLDWLSSTLGQGPPDAD